MLQEAVIPKVDISNDKILAPLVEVLRDKLTDLAPSDSLILVDNYMFAPGIRDRRRYLEMLGDILGPVVAGVEEIRFVTSLNCYDRSLYQDATQILSS